MAKSQNKILQNENLALKNYWLGWGFWNGSLPFLYSGYFTVFSKSRLIIQYIVFFKTVTVSLS